MDPFEVFNQYIFRSSPQIETTDLERDENDGFPDDAVGERRDTTHAATLGREESSTGMIEPQLDDFGPPVWDTDYRGEEETDSPAVQAPSPTKKRSRPNRYKNASTATLLRRREQNRESQRLYRERKNARIVELEAQLAEVDRDSEILAVAFHDLQLQCTSLQVGRIAQWQRAAALSHSQHQYHASLELDPCLGGGLTDVDRGGEKEKPAVESEVGVLESGFGDVDSFHREDQG